MLCKLAMLCKPFCASHVACVMLQDTLCKLAMLCKLANEMLGCTAASATTPSVIGLHLGKRNPLRHQQSLLIPVHDFVHSSRCRPMYTLHVWSRHGMLHADSIHPAWHQPTRQHRGTSYTLDTDCYLVCDRQSESQQRWELSEPCCVTHG